MLELESSMWLNEGKFDISDIFLRFYYSFKKI